MSLNAFSALRGTSRKQRVYALLAAGLAVTVAASAPGSAASSRRAVAHGANGKKATARYKAEPRMSRLNHGAGEPTLGFTKNGEVFVTASDGCVTSCAGSTEAVSTVAPGGRVILASNNKGKTWVDRTPGAAGVSPHVISMDPYIYVDSTPDGNRIFNIDLTVACAELSFSDNGGQTWTTNPLACGEPINDHQTLFSGPPATSKSVMSVTNLYPKVLYYCFNHPAFTKCSKSLDGGVTFVPTAQITPPTCGGLNGHGVVDSKGTVYVPLASCGQPMLAISKDEGNTWNVVRTSSLPADGGGDPSVAVDSKDNVYYLFVDGEDRLPRLVTSPPGGTKWSKSIRVSPNGVTATNLATIDVGKPGNVAIAYYGTTMDDGKDQRWSGYIASGTGVLGKSPVFYTGTVNDPKQPLKMGACRGRCGRVLDFIDVEISPSGEPWGVYVDACMATCEKTTQESIADNEGLVGWLTGGPRLN